MSRTRVYRLEINFDGTTILSQHKIKKLSKCSVVAEGLGIVSNEDTIVINESSNTIVLTTLYKKRIPDLSIKLKTRVIKFHQKRIIDCHKNGDISEVIKESNNIIRMMRKEC